MERVRPLFFSLLFAIAFSSASAETLKLATWNIEHLRNGIAEESNPRTEADFERLTGVLDKRLGVAVDRVNQR